ncbi:MAG: hypothetical protein WCQ50_07920 [Spirochaetota bacterium]
MNPSRSKAARSLAGLILALSAPLDGEEFRALLASSLALPSDSQGVQLTLAYNEAFALTWPKDLPFVQGLEIELKAPPAVVPLASSLSWELWRSVDPAPQKTRSIYQGERILSQVLPSRAGFVIQIPLRGDHSLKSGPFATVIPTVLSPDDFPFLFRLAPLAKAIPPELEKASFVLRIKPLFTDEGGLRLGFRFPEGSQKRDLELSVDGKRVVVSDLLVQKPGSHLLRVSSDGFREETRSFTIEQGRYIDLEVELEDTSPVLVVEAPDSAVITLDGARINHVTKPSMILEPGEHLIACRIGDYSMTRKFSVFRGKNYRIVLSIDLVFQESP